MRTGKLKISDTSKITKVLNRYNYLLVLIAIALVLVDIDLFSVEPRFLITEGFLWKGFAIAFQVIFIASIVQWEFKKKRTIAILSKGTVVLGTHHGSERLRAKNGPTYYLHLFSYFVNGQKYQVSMKNKSRYVNSNYIVYQSDHPEKAIVFEELKSGLKKLVEESIH